MLSENRQEKARQIEMICIEDLVPQDHILRYIDSSAM